MSASAAVLTADEYEERRRCLEELKTLSKVEQEEVYRILKIARAEYSANSNGVFFDVSKLSAETFTKVIQFLEFCRKNRDEFAAREAAEQEAQEALVHGQ